VRPPTRPLILLLSAAALFAPSSAHAASVTKTYRSGQIGVGPYQVKQGYLLVRGPSQTPGVDGFITAMSVDVVDADGSTVPIGRLMLHHIVF
jgi:hypothetical protein